ncbi:MAG: tRNA (guanine(46)-N(7))-methyltransferase TrmB [Myxococcales bacterium]|jgi:tRNA (guanine-N7-)-methyltransferase
MGRRGLSRSIKRIPPSPQALATYLQLWRYKEAKANPALDVPRLDPAALFDGRQVYELEVGCGTGEVLCHMAAERPETGFLGVDPSTKSLFHAVRLAESMGLRNIRFLRAPIDALYPHLVDETVAAAYVHFPDPFVRARGQHKVLNPSFLARMHAAMGTGGLLSIVSDKAELFHEVLELIEQTPGWERAHAERFLIGFDPPVKSRYQRKWERFDLPALRLEVCKQPLAKAACA